MPTPLYKALAHALIDQLPPDATWDDLQRAILVHLQIAKGLAESMAGCTSDVTSVRNKYGLPPV